MIDLKIQKAKEIPLDRVIFYFVIFGLEMIDTFFKTQKVFVRVWKNILHVIMLFLVLYTRLAMKDTTQSSNLFLLSFNSFEEIYLIQF